MNWTKSQRDRLSEVLKVVAKPEGSKSLIALTSMENSVRKAIRSGEAAIEERHDITARLHAMAERVGVEYSVMVHAFLTGNKGFSKLLHKVMSTAATGFRAATYSNGETHLCGDSSGRVYKNALLIRGKVIEVVPETQDIFLLEEQVRTWLISRLNYSDRKADLSESDADDAGENADNEKQRGNSATGANNKYIEDVAKTDIEVVRA